MKRLSINQKYEALMNALKNFKFPEKYYIENSDSRVGQRFAIASKNTENSGIKIHTNYMLYEEMNCFLIGYHTAITNPLP